MFKRRSKSEGREGEIIIDNSLFMSRNLPPTAPPLDLAMSKGEGEFVLESDKNLTDTDLYNVIEKLTKKAFGKEFCSFYTQKRKQILPPSKLLIVDRPLSIDKHIKLYKTFSSIPMFEKNKTDILDFLKKINHLIEKVDFELTQGDVSFIIKEKLPPEMKNCVDEMNLNDMYQYLTTMYSNTLNSREAYQKIIHISTNTKFKSVNEFLEKILPILKEFENNESIKIQILTNIVPTILDEKLKDKYEDFLQTVERNEGFAKTNQIIQFLSKYSNDIEKYLATKAAKKFNEVSTSVMPTKNCTICGRNNHDESRCFKTMTCERCLKTGHPKGKCFQRCRLCNSKMHMSHNCDKFPNCEPVAQPCPRCVANLNVKLYHPQKLCPIK